MAEINEINGLVVTIDKQLETSPDDICKQFEAFIKVNIISPVSVGNNCYLLINHQVFIKNNRISTVPVCVLLTVICSLLYFLKILYSLIVY